MREEVKELAKIVNRITACQFVKKIREMNEKESLTPEEKDFLVDSMTERVQKNFVEYVEREQRRDAKKFAKEHPWMGNPYV